MKEHDYSYIIVETFYPSNGSNKIRVRAINDQGEFKKSYFVQCSKSITTDYPVGSKFKIQAKLTNREGTMYISSHYTWPYVVLND